MGHFFGAPCISCCIRHFTFLTMYKPCGSFQTILLPPRARNYPGIIHCSCLYPLKNTFSLQLRLLYSCQRCIYLLKLSLFLRCCAADAKDELSAATLTLPFSSLSLSLSLALLWRRSSCQNLAIAPSHQVITCLPADEKGQNQLSFDIWSSISGTKMIT